MQARSVASRQVSKDVSGGAFVDQGTGKDFETRPSVWDGFITPAEHFYVRSHSPTPTLDVRSWRLQIHGSGVKRSADLSYQQLRSMPQIAIPRVIECAGNGRRFFKQHHGRKAEGSQWGLGAMGCAEWSGVRLRDVLELAGVKDSARDVMPIGLDKNRACRPINLEKAMRDDTLLALAMNGEPLLPDHGFPARVVVSGWTGVANIKWIGQIVVSEEPLYSEFNTTKYVLVGPDYPARHPAQGPAITEMPVMSALDLDWPARISRTTTEMHGRSYAGEARVREVLYSIDERPWKPVEFVGPNIEGCWRLWRFAWQPTPGEHTIRVRATDERGRTQPDSVPWNQQGYLYNAVVAHPVTVIG